MQIKVVKVHDEKQAVFITTAYKQHSSLNEVEGSTSQQLEKELIHPKTACKKEKQRREFSCSLNMPTDDQYGQHQSLQLN